MGHGERNGETDKLINLESSDGVVDEPSKDRERMGDTSVKVPKRAKIEVCLAKK